MAKCEHVWQTKIYGRKCTKCGTIITFNGQETTDPPVERKPEQGKQDVRADL